MIAASMECGWQRCTESRVRVRSCFVVAANKDIIPHPRAIAYHDEVSLMESMTRERCLLYVALTRAKKSAHITSYGSISEFVAEIMAPQGT